MKIWHGYGSEHSMNLVMIGDFEDVHGAERAKQLIDWLTEKVQKDINAGTITVGEPPQRYSDDWLEFLGRLNVHYLGPAEFEQFAYDVKIDLQGSRIVLTTDEIDVAAFLKVLLNQGARVQIYSAHNYPETGFGRGSRAAKDSA